MHWRLQGNGKALNVVLFDPANVRCNSSPCYSICRISMTCHVESHHGKCQPRRSHRPVLLLRISENSALVYPKFAIGQIIRDWREPTLAHNGSASRNANLFTYHDAGENSLPLLRSSTVKFDLSPPQPIDSAPHDYRCHLALGNVFVSIAQSCACRSQSALLKTILFQNQTGSIKYIREDGSHQRLPFLHHPQLLF